MNHSRREIILRNRIERYAKKRGAKLTENQIQPVLSLIYARYDIQQSLGILAERDMKDVIDRLINMMEYCESLKTRLDEYSKYAVRPDVKILPDGILDIPIASDCRPSKPFESPELLPLSPEREFALDEAEAERYERAVKRGDIEV